MNIMDDHEIERMFHMPADLLEDVHVVESEGKTFWIARHQERENVDVFSWFIVCTSRTDLVFERRVYLNRMGTRMSAIRYYGDGLIKSRNALLDFEERILQQEAEHAFLSR